MKFLSCEKISEHKYKTPEGYLVCIDSILARTGKQTYKRREVFGVDCTDAENEVDVDRTPEEVFSDKTLASFENKPLTMEHPDEDVNINNHNALSVGFARDIKRGKTDKGEDVMLGTLVFTDADAIEAIESGDMTDLSCGYDCDIVDEAHPCQRNIRGNHIALCQQGRAGIARIVDSVEKITPSIKALGKWQWDDVMQDWYDDGRHMYYNEVVRKSGGKDSIHDNDDLPEEEDSEFLFRDAYGKEIIVTNWDGKNQFMVVYEGHEQLMNRRDVEQFLDRKGARFSRVLRDAVKKYEWYIRKLRQPANGKYWFEIADKLSDEHIYSLAETEEKAKQLLAEANRLNDSVKDAGRSAEQMAKNEIRKLEQEIAENEYELAALQKEDYRYGSAKSTNRKQAMIKAQLNTLRGKLNRLKHEWSYCLDSLREPTSSELKKFEDYLIQRHWHVKKLGVTWTGRIHYEVSKLIGQGENEKLLMSEIHSAEYTSGLDMTYSIGSTGKELKGVVDIDKVYVRDSNTYEDSVKDWVNIYPKDIKPGRKIKKDNEIIVVERIDGDYAIIKHSNGKKYKYDISDLVDDLRYSPRYSFADSLKQFKVKYKDAKGRQVIQFVKAKSLADAMKKVEGDK